MHQLHISLWHFHTYKRSTFFKRSLFLIQVWGCAHEFKAHMARRECRITWRLNSRQLWAARHGCWEPNSKPLQEQCELLLSPATTRVFSSHSILFLLSRLPLPTNPLFFPRENYLPFCSGWANELHRGGWQTCVPMCTLPVATPLKKTSPCLHQLLSFLANF